MPATRPAASSTDAPVSNAPVWAHAVFEDAAAVAAAYVHGLPLRAWCGLVWVPSRDPEGLPLCPACQQMVALVSD